MAISIQEQIADKNINLLHVKCTRGVYNKMIFKTVINGNPKYYTLSKLDWMKQFVCDDNELIAASCIECLCMHGWDIDEILLEIPTNFNRHLWCNKVIEMAEKQDKPDLLLHFLEEESIYLNKAILALKRKGHENYLTTLLLSNNPFITKAIMRMTKNAN